MPQHSQFTLTVRAYAKINLFLDILGLQGSMHTLRMVMQSISLYDELIFEPIQKKETVIICNEANLAENNIIQKAFHILMEKYPHDMKHGFRIHLTKNIPMGAGLAGGSADGAAMVAVCKEYFKLKIPADDLIAINLAIGSDVNFCYIGGTQIVEGTGDRLTLHVSPYQYFLLVYPGIHVNTKEAYRLWDLHMKKYKPMTAPLSSIPLYNAFEKVIFPMYPEIESVKKRLIELGAEESLMSGSGSTVFGIFSDKTSLEKAYKQIQKKGYRVFMVRKMNQGITWPKSDAFFY